MKMHWLPMILAVGISFEGCKTADPGAVASAAPAPASFSVEPVVVVAKTLDLAVSLPGELAPYEQVDIFARANGFVRTVDVDRGANVKAGQLLARLEAPELSSQRVEAEAKVAGDKSTLERLTAAQKQTPGAVAGHDIELAEAALQASAAKASSLRSIESYLVVTAPFDGVVTERSVHPGALVGPTTASPMLRVEAVKKLRLTVAVPEDQTSAVREGDALEFGVRAWPQRKFKGVVRRISHWVDPRTRTMPVELDVDNADMALDPGMYATVSWHMHRPAPTLFVPESAVVQTTDKTLVVRIVDGKADPVNVQRGVAMAGLVEVFGDLHTGDTVAKRGSEELKTGTTVTFRTSPAPSASAGGK